MNKNVESRYFDNEEVVSKRIVDRLVKSKAKTAKSKSELQSATEEILKKAEDIL